VAAVYFLGDISGVYWVVQFAAAVIAVGVARAARPGQGTGGRRV
jgi:hypothetical protein